VGVKNGCRSPDWIRRFGSADNSNDVGRVGFWDAATLSRNAKRSIRDGETRSKAIRRFDISEACETHVPIKRDLTRLSYDCDCSRFKTRRAVGVFGPTAQTRSGLQTRRQPSDNRQSRAVGERTDGKHILVIFGYFQGVGHGAIW